MLFGCNREYTILSVQIALPSRSVKWSSSSAAEASFWSNSACTYANLPFCFGAQGQRRLGLPCPHQTQVLLMSSLSLEPAAGCQSVITSLHKLPACCTHAGINCCGFKTKGWRLVEPEMHLCFLYAAATERFLR